jgi:hypothetical protein
MLAIPRTRIAAPAVLASAALALAFALPATASAATRTLTLEKAGAGTGTVASFPAGIACGATCSAPFAEGASVTLTAAIGANTLPVQWSGCDSVNAEGKCVVAMSAARTVKATFDLVQGQLTVTRAGTGAGTVTSSPTGIECGGICQASFGKGSTVTLTGSPAANSEAAQWTGCASVNGEGKCLVEIGAATSVKATFDQKPRLTVTKSGPAASLATVTGSPAGIACGASCQALYERGATVTLTATAPPGSHVKAVQWTGCGHVTGEDRCEVTMSEAKNVTAGFEFEAGFALYPVTVQKTGSGQGAVTGSPGQISCGSVCSGEYLTATSLTLTATPSPGSVFAHWSGGGCTGAGPCTIAVKAAKSITAVFTLSGQRTLTVQKNGAGQGTVTAKPYGIECGQACTSQVPAGKKVTLSAKPATGSAFAHWSGACSGAAKTCSVTMTEARSVTATFSGPPAPAPASAACLVPRLKGKSLAKAKRALAAAHCSLGGVSRPKRARGSLVVRSSSPAAGSSLAAGAKVGVRLGKGTKRR